MKFKNLRFLLGLLLAVPAVTAAEAELVAPTPAIELPGIGEEVSLEEIKAICLAYGLEDLWKKIERDPPARPFKSDGVTGWFDTWKGVSLYPAGFLHDLKYWAGYPGEEVERLIADAELMIDVARLLGSTEMAETMFHRRAARRFGKVQRPRFPGDLAELGRKE